MNGGNIGDCTELNGNISRNEQPQNVVEEEQDSMHIFDLNDDCLERIFLYVRESDLVRLFEASKRFKVAVVNSFKTNHRYFAVKPATHQKFISITYFGQFIKHLSIEVSENIGFRMLDRIVEKCGKHLISLRVDVNKLSSDLPYSAAWIKFLNNILVDFPNLQALNFYDSKWNEIGNVPILEPIAHAQPGLIELNCLLENHSNLQSMRNFIRLNPQLNSLAIRVIEVQLDSIVSLDLDRNLPNLKILRLNVLDLNQPLVPVETYALLEPIRFKNLTELNVHTIDYNVENILNLLAFCGGKISKLTLGVFGFSPSILSLSKSILRTIFRCRNLKHLTITGHVCVDDMIEMARSLPLLERLHITCHCFVNLSPQKIRQTLREFSELMELVIDTTHVIKEEPFFTKKDKEDYNKIADALKNTEWKAIDTKETDLDKYRKY